MPFFKILAKVDAWSTYIVEADSASEARDLWADESSASRCIEECVQEPTGSEELYSVNELAEHEGEAERVMRQLIAERKELDRLKMKQLKLSDAKPAS